MHRLKKIISFLLLLSAVFLGFYFWNLSSDKEETEDDFKKGVHQGRLLEKDSFKVEVLLDESGSEPRFKVYFYEKDKPLSPFDVNYKMQLKRLNKIENLTFEEKGGYLESRQKIEEPHSFKVEVSADFKGKNYHFEYESYEGLVELTSDLIEANGIKIEEAQPQELEVKITSLGKIVSNEEKTVYMAPRFAGVAQTVYKKLGDKVQKGDVLALIESNESLQEYEIKAPIDGTIITKNINPGMNLSGQENIFILSDLSTLWADFNIYPNDLSLIKVGDPIDIKSLNGTITEKTNLFYISAIADQVTQSVIARALVKNPDGFFKPQLYVVGEIDAKRIQARVAVKKEALQKMFGKDIVFIYTDGVFQAVPVVIGSQDSQWVEILSGLEANERYVSKNSFILKADVEKSGAEHDH